MLSRERASITRGALVNLQTQKMLEFFMNPTELSMSLTVNWTKQQTLGGTYERMHYRGTTNPTFPLELHFNRLLYADSFRTATNSAGRGGGAELSPSELKEISDAFEGYRRFLLALAYPVGNVREVLRRSPPHALLLWPKVLAVRVVLTSLTIRDTSFANDGAPSAFNASCTFEEFRTYRLTSSDVTASGMVRHTGAGGEGAS